MSGKSMKLSLSLLVILTILSVVPMLGASAVVGSVAGGTNATIGGQVLVPNTTLFSGDSLRVRDGAAVVAMGMGSRMVFGRETEASFERGADEVTVTLGQGNVSMYHPENGMAMRVKIGEVSVLAEKGYKTLGEVAMVNGTVVVTAKDGMLRVQGPERTMEVTKGKTIAITPKTAGTPQPDQTAGAGAAASHLTTGQWLSIAGIGASGGSVATGVVSIKKSNDAKAAATTADADALAAKSSADAAASAASAAQAEAALANSNAMAAAAAATKAQCLITSPTNPSC
jgi:hypothetical protein